MQEISEGDKTAKEGLLLWAKTKVGEVSKGSVTVNNFHTSWQDGLAFNCLIQVSISISISNICIRIH